MSTANDLGWFIAVAEARSYRAAAEKLKVTPAAVSKRIKQLETQLDVRLLTRTTRNVQLTEAGELLFQRGKHLLEEMTALEESIRDSHRALRGKLSVNASMSYTHNVALEPILAFLSEHPNIEFSLMLEDSFVDVAKGDYDVVIRIGKLTDSTIVARPISTLSFFCCAAPSFLNLHGMPESPSDLSKFSCLGYEQHGQVMPWEFEKGGNTVRANISYKMRSNNGEVLREAAVAGHGIVLIPDFLARRALSQGSLVQLFQDWTTESIPINALYPSRKYMPVRVTRFIEHLRRFL